MIVQRIGECSNPSVQTPLRDGFMARAFSWHGHFYETGIEEARGASKKSFTAAPHAAKSPRARGRALILGLPIKFPCEREINWKRIRPQNQREISL